jgi:hypothetical protein
MANAGMKFIEPLSKRNNMRVYIPERRKTTRKDREIKSVFELVPISLQASSLSCKHCGAFIAPLPISQRVHSAVANIAESL